jgi:hypothetical protein
MMGVMHNRRPLAALLNLQIQFSPLDLFLGLGLETMVNSASSPNLERMGVSSSPMRRVQTQVDGHPPVVDGLAFKWGLFLVSLF